MPSFDDLEAEGLQRHAPEARRRLGIERERGDGVAADDVLLTLSGIGLTRPGPEQARPMVDLLNAGMSR